MYVCDFFYDSIGTFTRYCLSFYMLCDVTRQNLSEVVSNTCKPCLIEYSCTSVLVIVGTFIIILILVGMYVCTYVEVENKVFRRK